MERLTTDELNRLATVFRDQVDDFARQQHGVTVIQGLDVTIILVSVVRAASALPVQVQQGDAAEHSLKSLHFGALQPGSIEFRGKTAALAYPSDRAWWEAMPTRVNAENVRLQARPYLEIAGVLTAGDLINVALTATAQGKGENNG